VSRFSDWAALARRHRNVLIFLGGFLFDALTIKRIDSWADLAIQLAYLAALTYLLVHQYREGRGEWSPGPRLARAWRYNVEALHFFYGGLLSAYVVLYFKSSSGAKPWVFFGLLVALLVLNEMPAVRRVGHRLRLGLYAFCVASFLIYFLPVVLGRMGAAVFGASLGLSAWLVWKLATALAGPAGRARLFGPALGVLAVLGLLYAGGLVPPVPLSASFDGIFHQLEKVPDGYVLRTPKPPWYAFWRKESRPFRARAKDEMVYFVSIYAPARFKHQVMIRWEYRDAAGRFVTSDLMPMRVAGGREQGFRGYAVKANYQPGRWRVRAETEDGRTISACAFDVLPDAGEGERLWREIKA
jgi:hypothetical protein